MTPKIQPYKDAAGEWRWRRVADNGNVIADSAEGYKNKGDMLHMAEANFPDDKLDWSLLPSKDNPDTLLDDGDNDDTNDG